MNAFNYEYVSPNQNESKLIICKVTKGTKKPNKTAKPSETTNSDNRNDHKSGQLNLKQQFKELFQRRGKVNKYKLKIEFD